MNLLQQLKILASIIPIYGFPDSTLIKSVQLL